MASKCEEIARCGPAARKGDLKLMPDAEDFIDGAEDETAAKTQFNLFVPADLHDSSRVRWAGKRFFLTYSRCPLSKPDVADEFQKRWPGQLDRWVISQETHLDGERHLHALIEFKSKKNFKEATWADIKGYHGNYSPPRQYIGCLCYLLKEDTQPLANWDYLTYVEKLRRKGRINSSVINVNLIDRGALYMVNSGIIHVKDYINVKRNIREVLDDRAKAEPLDQIRVRISPWNSEPVWDTVNLLDGCHQHYWVHGGSGTGKTFVFEKQQESPVYIVPKTKNWVGFQNQPLLLINEFKGEFTAAELIDIMESRTQDRKYGEVSLTRHVVVVTSNYTMEEAFPSLIGHSHFTALKRRFVEIEYTAVHPKAQEQLARSRIVFTPDGTRVNKRGRSRSPRTLSSLISSTTGPDEEDRRKRVQAQEPFLFAKFLAGNKN